jgi:hypothetical protein
VKNKRGEGQLNLVTGLKVCSRCRDEFPEGKPASTFRSDKSRPDGLYPWCGNCSRAAARLHMKTEKAKTTRSAWLKRCLEVAMYYNSRDRAIRQSLPFSITKEDILVPESCPVCGCEMVSGDGKHRMDSPSLDKWDPSLGYVKGNVWVICMRCNLRKGDLPGEELVAFAFKCIEAFKEHCDRMA